MPSLVPLGAVDPGGAEGRLQAPERLLRQAELLLVRGAEVQRPAVGRRLPGRGAIDGYILGLERGGRR